MVQPVVNTSSLSAVDTLTPTELEIWRLVAQGYSNKEIQSRRHVSHTTLTGQLHILYRKLGIHKIAVCHNTRSLATRMWIESFGL